MLRFSDSSNPAFHYSTVVLTFVSLCGERREKNVRSFCKSLFFNVMAGSFPVKHRMM